MGGNVPVISGVGVDPRLKDGEIISWDVFVTVEEMRHDKLFRSFPAGEYDREDAILFAQNLFKRPAVGVFGRELRAFVETE